ncbi:MAG: outer membrane beta-barrel protein [Chitinophagaceae bacterium]
MKRIFLAVIALMGLVVSQAQLKVGIKAGGNLSNQHSNAALGTKLLSKDAFRGFHAGLVADVHVFGNLYVQQQLLYTQNGAKYTSKVNGYETKLTARSIETPVNILYKVNTSFGKIVAGGGPSVSYGFGGKMEQNGQTKKLYSGAMKDFRRIDISANAIAGVEFNNGLFTSVNYQMGLRDMNKIDGINTKNRSVSVSVGYLIDWNKSKRKG